MTNSAPPETRGRGLHFAPPGPNFRVISLKLVYFSFGCILRTHSAAPAAPLTTRGAMRGAVRVRPQTAASNFHPLRIGNFFAGVPLRTPLRVRPTIEED
jgi:hypothetical protein